MSKPRVLVLASGGKTGGGSGFEKLVRESRGKFPTIDADLVGVASNHSTGGVQAKADNLNVPFHFMESPFTAKKYQALVECVDADWVACSGWLKLVKGLDPAKTFNIHPGPLPDFGGKGMHGHYVHEAVMEAYRAGTLTHSAVSMHFVDDEYDHGQLFFRLPVEIYPDDTPDTLGVRVNEQEHIWQPFITNMVVHGQIRLTRTGRLILPKWYSQMKFCPLSAIG